MIRLDALRTALQSDQPYSRLDDLVRAELSDGRLTKQIRAELLGLEGKVGDLLEGNEVADDALRDTIDALAGFCPARYAYHNPPILPNEEEIAELPRWAQSAFAARCARRVLPLFKQSWPNAPKEHVGTVENDIEVAELSAAHAKVAARRGDIDTIVAAIEAYTHDYPVARSAARAAFRAAQSAEIDSTHDFAHDIANSSAEAAAAAAEAADAANINVDIRPAIRRDFDDLVDLARQQRWNDDTPIVKDVFGPLWPEGPPIKWPTNTDVSQPSQKQITAR